MAHRQEEKERRREERLAREAAAKRAAAQRARVRMAIIGGVVVAVIAAGVVLLVSSGGGGSKSGPIQPQSGSTAAIPAQKESDFEKAAAAANCTLQHPPIEGREHESRTFTEKDYRTNPPTSGNHYPAPAEDGIYNPGDTPPLGQIVHSLEHGRVEIQYKPGTPKHTISQLETLAGTENDGYHVLMFENTTKMPYAVAAAAWGQLIGCPTMNNNVFDALRTFYSRYVDKGPESVP